MHAPETAVEEVMTSPVETVTGQTRVREAALRMAEEGIGSLVVDGICDDGIVTKTDLVAGLGHGVDPDETPVAGVMSSPVITVDAGAELQDAVDLMTANGVKRLPVEDGDDLAGIVTTTDLVAETSTDFDRMVDVFADAG